MKYTIFLGAFVAVFVSASVAEARFYYKDGWDDLDDDPVETFPIPVLFGVEHDDVVPDYGDPRGGGTRSHEGQDFIVPQGTPIVSPTEAVVLRIGTGASAGKYVYTANPGGETFRYMHLDEVATNLDEGDELEVGELIGTVGDTGNAAPGQYHLHFETRDEDNRAQDPYDRLDVDGWTLREKVSFLDDIFRGVKDDDEYAEMLVENFGDELTQALNNGYKMPDEIEEALEDSGIISRQEQLDALERAMKNLPFLLRSDLTIGDQNLQVAVLQMYLTYMSNGTARDRLKAAGVTGYYGQITADAVAEYQREHFLTATGVLDAATRADMQENNDATLDLF